MVKTNQVYSKPWVWLSTPVTRHSVHHSWIPYFLSTGSTLLMCDALLRLVTGPDHFCSVFHQYWTSRLVSNCCIIQWINWESPWSPIHFITTMCLSLTRFSLNFTSWSQTVLSMNITYDLLQGFSHWRLTYLWIGEENHLRDRFGSLKICMSLWTGVIRKWEWERNEEIVLDSHFPS